MGVLCIIFLQWPSCTIGSRDKAGGQGPRNRHTKMYGERGQRGTKPAVVRDRDNGWNSDSLWLFYGGLP